MSAPSSPTEIDELARTARTDATPAGVNLLWRAVYRLDRWWLLPTGDPADPRPMVGIVDDRTFLLAFTSDRHLRDFAVAQGRTGEIPAMSVTPQDLTGMVAALVGQGVAGILFDQGVHSFVAPVAALQDMWARFSAER